MGLGLVTIQERHKGSEKRDDLDRVEVRRLRETDLEHTEPKDVISLTDMMEMRKKKLDEFLKRFSPGHVVDYVGSDLDHELLRQDDPVT